MLKIKLGQEFKNDMKVFFIVLFILIFISCVYYSWCMLLIDTFKLPIPELAVQEIGILEIIFFGSLYTCLFFMTIVTVLCFYDIIIRFYNYIFE